MLRITVIKNADGAIKYYESALSVQDYYTEKTQIKGRWEGSLTSVLGLQGDVQKEQFEKIANNRHPFTGKKLTPRDSASRRSGYDFTFNAKKSISIVYAITGDEDILKAHQQAVRQAMSAVEKNMQTQTGQGKDKKYVTTGNVLYSVFDHLTARPVKIMDKYISDPNLHSHAVLQNLTWFNEKGRFQALEIGNIKKEAQYYEALYHSKIAQILEQKGYEIEYSGNSFEIKGIEKSTIQKFSNRTKLINSLIEKHHITDAKVKDKIGGWSREKKSLGEAEGKLLDLWMARLSSEEIKTISGLKKTSKTGGNSTSKKGFDVSKSIDLAMDHYLERKSVANTKQVLGLAMKLSNYSRDIEELRSELLARPNIIKVDRGHTSLFTTREMIQKEKEVLQYASDQRGRLASINPDYEFENTMLNKGQRNAVHHVLNSHDGVVLISGDAGVGKTTLLLEVKKGIEDAGLKLFAFAPSASASRGELQFKGFENATTITSMLRDNELHQKMKGQVMLIDESFMVGTKTMHDIMAVSKQNNIRLILSGDYKQHHAIEAGDPSRALENKLKLPIARVKENIRQKNNLELQKAVTLLGQGRQEEAFNLLDKNGNIIEIQDNEQRLKQVAKTYLQTIQENKSIMVVSPTHREGQKLTAYIRDELKSNGILKGNEYSFHTQKTLSYTRTEKQDPLNYTPGMVIQFHKRTEGFRHGFAYEVIGYDEKGQILVKTPKTKPVALPLQEYDNFNVYNRETTKLAQGDLMRITQNGKTTEGKTLHNGDILKVKSINNKGEIITVEGKTISGEYGHFTQGYYRTSIAAQGRDAHVLLLSQGSESFPASNEKQFYTSVTRGAKEIKIFTDDKEELRKSIQNPDDRMEALELESLWQRDIQLRAYEAMNERLVEQKANSKNLNHEKQRTVQDRHSSHQMGK